MSSESLARYLLVTTLLMTLAAMMAAFWLATAFMMQVGISPLVATAYAVPRQVLWLGMVALFGLFGLFLRRPDRIDR